MESHVGWSLSINIPFSLGKTEVKKIYAKWKIRGADSKCFKILLKKNMLGVMESFKEQIGYELNTEGLGKLGS